MISRKMKIPDFHKISYVLVSIDTVIVGVAGFEPATSASQTRRDNRATLHPELVIKKYVSQRIVAERQGFEPWVNVSTYDDLANRSFRPLRHLSSNSSMNCCSK